METGEKTMTKVAMRKPDFTDQLIEPFNQLRSEVDRLFEGFPLRMPALKLPRFAAVPALEMSETDKAYKLTAEIPGIDPAEVEVTFEDGILRIAGEKKQEREENERGYRLAERSYGAFERLLELPTSVNPAKISAAFKNGVLTVTVPKNGTEKKRNIQRIKVHTKP